VIENRKQAIRLGTNDDNVEINVSKLGFKKQVPVIGKGSF